MAWSGINKKKLASFGGEAHCFMSDDDVAKEAKEADAQEQLSAWKEERF